MAAAALDDRSAQPWSTDERRRRALTRCVVSKNRAAPLPHRRPHAAPRVHLTGASPHRHHAGFLQQDGVAGVSRR